MRKEAGAPNQLCLSAVYWFVEYQLSGVGKDKDVAGGEMIGSSTNYEDMFSFC
jgi:hypothetical protein